MHKHDVTEEVFLLLQAQILNFKLLPGVKISDKEVAAGQGLSRTPVREALIRLAGQGLVEARHNRGFTVKIFSIKEIEDLYTMRATLEEMSVGLATQNLDPDHADQLQRLLETYPPLMKAQDLVRFNEADDRFHELIASASRNALLAKTLKNLQGQIRIVRRYDHLRPSSFKETYDEHQQILGHILQGETTRAKKAVSRHILKSMQIIIGVLKQTSHEP